MTDDSAAVADFIERIGQLLRSGEQSGGLNPAQWAALRYLARANRFSRNPIALTRYLATTRGTTSQTLIALERKGYLTRTQSPRDKRSVDLALTEKGRKKLKDDPIVRLGDVAGEVLGRDGANARDLLSCLLARLVALNDGRMFGQCRTCRHFRRGAGKTKSQPHFCALLTARLSDADSEKICVEQEPQSALPHPS